MFTVKACRIYKSFLHRKPKQTDKMVSCRKFNYELFNCNNINIRYRSWNYRGCWHQTCPPIGFGQSFNLSSLHFQNPEGPNMLFLLTTSLSQDWVIYAPAAFLRNGSRFSGSLSGIEPQFPVTRDCHGSPIHYHRELIGQKLIWCGAFYCALKSYYHSCRYG